MLSPAKGALVHVVLLMGFLPLRPPAALVGLASFRGAQFVSIVLLSGGRERKRSGEGREEEGGKEGEGKVLRRGEERRSPHLSPTEPASVGVAVTEESALSHLRAQGRLSML